MYFVSHPSEVYHHAAVLVLFVHDMLFLLFLLSTELKTVEIHILNALIETCFCKHYKV